MKNKLANKASDIVRWRPKPTLSIDSRDLSSVKDMQVGKSYTFTVTAKVTEVRSRDDDEYYEGDSTDKSTTARLRITKITEK
jgi:hypothetical protein